MTIAKYIHIHLRYIPYINIKRFEEPKSWTPINQFFFFSPWTLKVPVNPTFSKFFTGTFLRSRAHFGQNSRARGRVHGHFFGLFHGHIYVVHGHFFMVHGHFWSSRAPFFLFTGTFSLFTATFLSFVHGQKKIFTGIFFKMFTGIFWRFTGKKKKTLP